MDPSSSSSPVPLDSEDFDDGDTDILKVFKLKIDPSASASYGEDKVESSGEKSEKDYSLPPSPASLYRGDDFIDGEAEKELGTDLVRAAMDGNVKIFDDKKSKLSDEQFFRKTVENNNILHIAIRYRREKFVTTFLEKYFAINTKLITERNSHENTPLHVAATVRSCYIVQLLYDYLKKSDVDDEKPWRAQNSKGNTALHVALLCNDEEVAEYLVKKDDGLARIVNHSQEAPLHLAIIHLEEDRRSKTHMIKVLLRRAGYVASRRDGKGLTPLLRAAYLLNPLDIVQVTKEIISFCPESILVCDHFGQSFLHLLMHNNKLINTHPKKSDKQLSHKRIQRLISRKEISILIDHQDQDGNTPLHIAAMRNNIPMVRYLRYKCNNFITNTDGISARSLLEELDFSRQHDGARAMAEEERMSAMGNISYLVRRIRIGTLEGDFFTSRDSRGNNFLHLLMNKTTEHHSISKCRKYFDISVRALSEIPKLILQRDQTKNTPVHILAQNKDFCTTLADAAFRDPELGNQSLLSKLLSEFAEAVTGIERSRTTIDEVDNYDQPWVMKNANDNTPLLEAIMANNKILVLELLSYSKEAARVVNKHKDTPLHLLAAGIGISKEEFMFEEVMKLVNANIEALGLLDKDDLTPILRALKAENLQMVVAILCIVKKISDNDGPKFWHHVLNHSSKNFVKDLLHKEAFRNILQQKDKDGYTPFHLAMKEKCFGFVEDILETWGRERQLPEGEEPKSNQWLMDLLKIIDKDGLTPTIRALNADNLDLATKLCHVNPEATKMGDINGKTIWHLLSKPLSYKSETVKELLKTEAIRKVLEQKDKNGNTPLHLAIKEKCFGFVQDLLEASGSEYEFSEGDPWPMDLLRTPNNIGETPEDLLADLLILPHKLEEKLLTDRRMMGIRSSWRIPRTQLQNYMKSINVIAALQTTITFTAAFTVPGGIIQDKGFPILIPSIAFQVFMVSDVVAMCLSMMVLICPFWMVSGTKRKSVEIQDFTLSLLQASFVATLLTFMSGVFATIYPVKPWIAITTLVLCSLLTLLLHKFIVTELILPFKRATVNFVKRLWDPAAAFCSKTLLHTHRDNSDTSPCQRNIACKCGSFSLECC